MTKKIVALVLVLAMVFVFAACAQTTTPAASEPAAEPAESAAAPAESTEPEPAPADEGEAPYTLVYYMYSTQASNQDVVVEAAINEYIQPKINANIDFIMIPGGDWQQKALVPLQSGETIDIFWTPEWMYFMQNLSQGLLLALDDPEGPYGDLAHTYAQETLDNLGGFVPANIVDGHLWTIPTKKELCVPAGLMWNQDYVEKYNIDVTAVKTLEDLEPILAAFNEEGVYPLLSTGGTSSMVPYVQGFVSNMEPVTEWVGKSGEAQEPILYWQTDEMKNFCLTQEKWMAAGYLNPDSYLTTYTNMDFLNAGQFLVSFDYVLKGGQVKANELMAQSGNSALRLVEQQVGESVNVTTHAGGSMLGIPVTSGDPVKAIQYINLMHTDPTLLNLMAWGIEGVHYDMADDGRVTPKDANGWSDSHGGMWTLGDQFKQYISTSEDPEKYNQMLALTAEAWNHDSLGFRFVPDDYATEFASIKAVNDTYSRSMRTGIGVTENYDKFQAELDAAGLQTVYNAIVEQYNAWKASK